METMQSSLAGMTATPTAGRVLVVDDEAALRRASTRVLGSAGYTVVEAADGALARNALDEGQFDAIVSDICMPGMSGIELLRYIRGHDADVPVLLMTGNPEVATAVQSLTLGAVRYLIKPVAKEELLKNVDEAVAIGRLARMRRENLRHMHSTKKIFGDRATLGSHLDHGIATLWMAYQPIVNWKTHTVIAHEALLRSGEPALPQPGAVLAAAERLDRVHEVGRAVRAVVARDVQAHPLAGDMFVNLHPADLKDEQLYAPEAPLTPFAARIVLEITERAEIDVAVDVAACVARLRECGYRIAIDDLGSGFSGLNYFAQLTPDVAKIDMFLVRDVDKQIVKRKLVESLLLLCKELEVAVIAEGVESVGERDAIASLGCDLFQGYLFARPEMPFPKVAW